MPAPSFEEMEKTASSDIPKAPSFEDMEKAVSQEAPKPQPGLSASVAKNVKAQQTPDWLNFMHGIPVVGDVVRGGEQVIQNVGKAGQEFQKDPLSSAMAATGGAASGATSAVEAPAALAGNAITNLLIPPELRTQRRFPQQIAGTPEAQAAQVLQQKQAAEPQQYSYPHAVGGVPFADRIQQATQQAFPNEPGSIATGQVAGGLAVPIKGLPGGAGRTLLGNAGRGALEGALIGEGYHLGEQAAHGQPLQPSAVPALGGGLAGAGIRSVGTLLNRARTPKETTEVQPREEVPKTEKKVVGQVIKPKPLFKDANAAIDAWFTSKDPNVQQAAKEFLEKTQGGRTYQEPQPQIEEPTPPQPEPQLKGKVEENVPKEEETQTSPQLQALYEKVGKKPTETTETQPEENIHLTKYRVPIEDVKEYNPETRTYSKPFDISHNEPREVKWRGRTYGAVHHPEEGFVTIGGEISGRGVPRRLSVFKSLEQGTAIPQQAFAKGRFNEIQQHANERGLEEAAKGNVPKPQTEALEKAAKQQEEIQKALDAVENNDESALQRFLDEERGSAAPDYPFRLIIEGAKKTGQTIGEFAKQVYGPKWVQSIKDTLKFHSTMDDIYEGSHEMGLDVYDQLQANRNGEALDRWNQNWSGLAEEEARDALRRLRPGEILDSPEETPSLTPQQRLALATTRIYREDSKRIIAEALREHGQDMSKRFRDALQNYSEQQYGYTSNIKGSPPLEEVLAGINQGVYTGFFRNNPAFSGMVLSHTAQLGPSVLGVRNLVEAYDLVLNDAETQEFLGGAKHVTEDPASRAAQDRLDEQSGIIRQINEATLPGFKEDMAGKAGEFNNKVFLMGGLLKTARQMYGSERALDAVRQVQRFVKDPELSAMDRAEVLQMLNGGLNELNRGTGGGSFGMDLSMGQKTPYLRTYGQLSRYKGTVNRLYARYAQDIAKGGEARTAALAGIGTLLGANILLGGHSGVIPKEAEKTLYGALGPNNMLAIEYTLDQMNLLAKTPFVGGISINDHIQPALWNWATNVATETAAQTATKLEDIWKKDEGQPIQDRLADFIGRAFMLIPIAVGGIGTGTWVRATKAAKDAMKGERNISVYPTTGLLPAGHPIGKGKMTYTLADFLHSIFLPGVETREQNFKQAKRVSSIFKSLGREDEIPANLEQDVGGKKAMYPHPGIE